VAACTKRAAEPAKFISFSRMAASQLRHCNRPLSRSSPPDRAWDRLALLAFPFLIFARATIHTAPNPTVLRSGPKEALSLFRPWRSVRCSTIRSQWESVQVEGDPCQQSCTRPCTNVVPVEILRSLHHAHNGGNTIFAQAWQFQSDHWMDRSRPRMITGSKRSVRITEEGQRKGRSDEER
jgi:hypothetical protein